MSLKLRHIPVVACLAALAGGVAAAQDAGPSLTDITEAWLNSPHADRSSEAFTHWNEDGEIPGTCAVCHSSIGVIDYLSGPMSMPGRIDHSVALGSVVDCSACHSRGAAELAAVPFPSGEVIEIGDGTAICAVCHQGRASTDTVVSATEGIQDDTISGDLSFINVHYAPSAATQLGTQVRAGFEYPGKVYQGRFDHVPDLNTCTSCHSPHTLNVELESCTTCHQNVDAFTDIRVSPTDFDGDGDTTEGIAAPIAEMHAQLDNAIRAYALDVVGSPVIYADAFPYFFNDSDANGAVTDGEAAFPNRYQSWTPRLLKAAYNYQVVAKDHAIFTHNPHYALQLLYDSLESLSEEVQVDMSGLTRP